MPKAIPQRASNVLAHSDVRFATAVASISLVHASNVLDLADNDYKFLTGDKLWLAVDRNRAMRCLQSVIYGALDYVGFPRVPAPAEFVAAVICYFVHPVNIQSACSIMDRVEFSDCVISGQTRELTSDLLFAFVLRIRAGLLDSVHAAESNLKNQLMGAALNG